MRRALILAAVLGFIAVALGAFGAHGLKPYLEGRHEADPERATYLLDVWETACDYALAHALALLALASLRARVERKALGAATWLFLAGSAVFSGTLWLLVLTDLRWLGAITPLGGLLLLGGWIACGLGAGGGRPAAGETP